jgi:hypothetical protein
MSLASAPMTPGTSHALTTTENSLLIVWVAGSGMPKKASELTLPDLKVRGFLVQQDDLLPTIFIAQSSGQALPFRRWRKP